MDSQLVAVDIEVVEGILAVGVLPRVVHQDTQVVQGDIVPVAGVDTGQVGLVQLKMVEPRVCPGALGDIDLVDIQTF